MVNKIIDGISLAINGKFGDRYEIYTESVKQGLKEPCFLITCVQPSIQTFMGKRYFRSNLFCIHFFPGSDDPKLKCYNVLDKLYDALELITVDGDLIRGSNVQCNFSDGVMNVFVNYDLFVYDHQATAESMADHSFTAKVK